MHAAEIWKLWRTLPTTGDTDEYFDDGDASAVAADDRIGVTRAASGDRMSTSKVEFVVIAVDNSTPPVQVPNDGTYTARVLQFVQRDRERRGVPGGAEAIVGSEIEAAIPVGEIRTVQCTGGVQVSIEIDTVAALDGDAAALEVWIREVT